MKCVAAAVSGRGGDPRVVRSCRVIKSRFVGVERSALNVVSLEVEVIVRWAVGDNDKSFKLPRCEFKLPVHGF
ncbi:unnamed protein product [Brassica oleracea var. botrytis]